MKFGICAPGQCCPDGHCVEELGLHSVERYVAQSTVNAVTARIDAECLDAKRESLREARRVITQYLSTAEKWRYDRVCWAFAIMLGEIPESTPEPLSPADERYLASKKPDPTTPPTEGIQPAMSLNTVSCEPGGDITFSVEWRATQDEPWTVRNTGFTSADEAWEQVDHYLSKEVWKGTFWQVVEVHRVPVADPRKAQS